MAALSASRLPILSVEFGVMPEDAVLVERDAAVRGEIGGDAGAGGDAIMHTDDARMSRFEPRHHAWKGIAQPGDDLEQRQVGIGEFGADEMLVARRVVLQYPPEIAEIFRRPRFHKIGRPGLRLPALIFVVEA